LTAFAPDKFSVSLPVWNQTSTETKQSLHSVLTTFSQQVFSDVKGVLQSGAFGLNSSNFQLLTDNGRFLLKRWPLTVNKNEVENTLAVMHWLHKSDLPVPNPVPLGENERSVRNKTGNWALLPFVEGQYFTGNEGELDELTGKIGTLFKTLARIPLNLRPGKGPDHLSEEDGKLFETYAGKAGMAGNLRDQMAANLFTKWMPLLCSEWNALTAKGLPVSPIQSAHFDLHPHNILVDKGHVVAILDFDSCRTMALGPPLGFAGLKLCRQAIVAGKRTLAPAIAGNRFRHLLRNTGVFPDILLEKLGDLAIAEVLRRVALILRLNLEDGNDAWNHVLPIQLGHLLEARALFD
jgi:hypothetical protein